MSERDTKDAGGSTRSYAALTAFERLEALALADEMMLRHVVDRRVEAALRERYRLSASGARRVLREALRAADEALAEGLAHRRAVYVRSLSRLYERAWAEGKLGTCVATARLIADAEGHNRPQRVLLQPASADPVEAEFQGRSESELEHYAVHGRWPEGSAPVVAGSAQQATNGKREFPLH